MTTLRRLALGVAWIACVALLAAGSAGLVAGLTHPPGSTARAELTWAADEAIRPGLEAASTGLARLSGDVDRLGLQGRAALAALVARDQEVVAGAVAEGTSLIATIEADSQALGRQLGSLPGAGAGMEGRFGADVLRTYDGIEGALAGASGLAESWATFTSGSANATRLITLLEAHDMDAGEAARLGSKGSYAAALTALGRSTAALDEATRLRDELENTTDVSVLDEWISRNRDLDVALGRLYRALRSSRGVVTTAVRDAAAAERAAQERLPPDTRGLVVIMADVARGGLNQAVIAIEEVRGTLATAVAALDAR